MNQPLPSAGTVDPWPEILHLLPQKITFKGHAVAGTPEQLRGFVRWMIQNMPGVVPAGDAETQANCFLSWLRSETHYEADTTTRTTKSATPPDNPISDQTVAQQAQPAAAASPATPPATEEAAGADESLICPECGTKTKNLSGLKRHVTMTHKTEWAPFAQKYGLDVTTGLKLGTAASLVASAQALSATPSQPPPPPVAPPVPPMFGAHGQASQPPSFVAPAPPAQTSIPFTAPAQVASQQPTGPLFAGPAPQQSMLAPQAVPPTQGAFPAPGMPAPPAQVAAAPLTGPAAPVFVPPAFAPAPAGVAQPPTPPAAPALQPSPAPGPLVAFNPAQSTPVAFPATPPAPVMPGAPSREMIAQALGGAVQLTIVKLLDAATFKLDGLVDVNQLAALAENRARQEMKVADLAQASYGQGKQAAQRHFAELLNQSPSCYLLLNGYEPILPAGYLEILAARVTRFTVVTDGGRQVNTIF